MKIMDAKVTLSFNEDVIVQAKEFAAKNNISLSRLTEFLLKKAISKTSKSLDELPVSDWVMQVSEGEVEYVRQPKSNETLKKAFYTKKKLK
jgi:hypothetical protein